MRLGVLKFFIYLSLVFSCFSFHSPLFAKAFNGTMMQYFEWNLPDDGKLWDKISSETKHLAQLGITALWLPPAFKQASSNSVGYGPYDLYDLGEFEQKGCIRTKYGTKDQYLAAINSAHLNNIQVYADIVLNHRMGADSTEWVDAVRIARDNRNNQYGQSTKIRAWTVFDFLGRQKKYSDFTWRWSHFNGVDWDDQNHEGSIFKFATKNWDWEVDSEFGNYDFLMGADLDMDSLEVQQELKNWGLWYLNFTQVDGFRIDAIKHIKFDVISAWINYLRKESKKELFTVGEYWSHDVNKLKNFLAKTSEVMSLFDAPLHYNFYAASKAGGYYDMGAILNNTLMKEMPIYAVTLVDNHDTQPGQALESYVETWFKTIAYAFILTREEGYPCVFYGDYYGINKNNIAGLSSQIDYLLRARKYYAFGPQHSYLDHHDIVGWTREGEEEHKNSGLATLVSDGPGGSKNMYVGLKHKGKIFYDYTKNRDDKVIINNMGFGEFKVNGGSVSVWVAEEDLKSNKI